MRDVREEGEEEEGVKQRGRKEDENVDTEEGSPRRVTRELGRSKKKKRSRVTKGEADRQNGILED